MKPKTVKNKSDRVKCHQCGWLLNSNITFLIFHLSQTAAPLQVGSSTISKGKKNKTKNTKTA